MATRWTFEWDERKAATNAASHRVSFDLATAFDFDAAIVQRDERRDYGEERFVAVGPVGDRLHVLVYTMRETAVRVISLRKANDREIDAYEKEMENDP